MEIYIAALKKIMKLKKITISDLAVAWKMTKQAVNDRINRMSLEAEMQEDLAQRLGLKLKQIKPIPPNMIKTFLHREFLNILKKL